MNDIQNIVDELGIAAFEQGLKIAAIAVISNSGDLITQTKNWDLKDQTHEVLNVLEGGHTFTLNGTEYSVVETTENWAIGTSKDGMGHILIFGFNGGILVTYAMPQANPKEFIQFLEPYASKLAGTI